ncbi:hypothetical protein ACP70R_039451 [Stipagrostis hirtigluma subsp. patula]
MASKQGSNRPAAAAAGVEVDPKYEWQDNATSYVLRVHLTGFRKEDFRVQVTGAGRLTVRGQRAAGGKQYRLHKDFQLPNTADLDNITGRFDAGVLTLTVPKRPAAPPATVEEIIKRPAQEAGDAKPKVTDEPKKPPPPQQHERGKPKDEAKKQAERKEEMKKPQDDAKPKEDGKKKAELAKEEAEAKRSKQEPQEKKAAPPPPPPAARKEEDKPKPEAAAAAPTEKKQAPPEPKQVDQESLAERVRRRRAEEEREKAAAAAAAAEEAERQRRQTAACGGWKERVAEELEGLTSSEWAESLVETVKKNKEVIAVAAAVAALSVGLFVSRKLFSRN